MILFDYIKWKTSTSVSTYRYTYKYRYVVYSFRKYSIIRERAHNMLILKQTVKIIQYHPLIFICSFCSLLGYHSRQLRVCDSGEDR